MYYNIYIYIYYYIGTITKFMCIYKIISIYVYIQE
jgi:hypothetical protein